MKLVFAYSKANFILPNKKNTIKIHKVFTKIPH